MSVAEKDSNLKYRDEMDTTLWLAAMLRLIRKELDLTQARIDAIRSDQLALARSVRGDLGINHRQRAILSRAPADPMITLRIGPHSRAHGIAYSTARGPDGTRCPQGSPKPDGGYRDPFDPATAAVKPWASALAGRYHLGGTAFPVQAMPEGLMPWYLELTELPGLNFGGGTAQIDLESDTFDWPCD